MKPSGTFAACRFFYERIECLLDKHGDEPFSYVVATTRGYEERADGYQVFPLRGRHPRPPADPELRLDMRYLDALPLIVDTYLEERRQSGVLFKILSETLRDAPGEIQQFAEHRLISERDDFTYELARDLALTLTRHGLFELFLVTLLAKTFFQTRGHGQRIANEMPPEVALKIVLKESLHLARYSRKAIQRLLAKRGWTDEFLRICATGKGEIRSTAEMVSTSKNR
jgi:hypothetical protein